MGRIQRDPLASMYYVACPRKTIILRDVIPERESIPIGRKRHCRVQLDGAVTYSRRTAWHRDTLPRDPLIVHSAMARTANGMKEREEASDASSIIDYL